MKKNRVNEFLEQTKLKKMLISYTCFIILLAFVLVCLILIFINNNKIHYVSYKENSNIDYKVFLRKNEFYENNYLTENNQYIASLVDYISANFSYDLALDENDINYQYSYRIDAEIIVKEKNNSNPIYNFKENLLKENEVTSDTDNKFSIKQSVNIDYNKYNDLIKKFVNTYSLDDVESTLSVKMYVDINGSCDDIENKTSNETVISLLIPLNTKTVSIDTNNDLIAGNNLISCKKTSKYNAIIIIAGIIVLLTEIYIIIKLINLISNNRTAESIFDSELKKILNNYSSYIQKINNKFDLSEYQVLQVDSFNDLLEIRDAIQSPILMVNSEEKKGAYFLIPSNSKLIYIYGLRLSEIEKKIKKD